MLNKVIIFLLILFAKTLNSQSVCRNRTIVPALDKFIYNNSKIDSMPDYLNGILNHIKDTFDLQWLKIDPKIYDPLYKTKKVFISQYLEDRSDWLSIDIKKYCNKVSQSEFSLGCKGLDFTIYEIYIPSDYIMNLLHCSQKVNNGVFSKGRVKFEWIIRKNMVYEVSYDVQGVEVNEDILIKFITSVRKFINETVP